MVEEVLYQAVAGVRGGAWYELHLGVWLDSLERVETVVCLGK
jgi:hypothetical protein